MPDCDYSCDTCGVEGCGERQNNDFTIQPNEYSNFKHVIGIVSGKGGVGKSFVTSLLASQKQKEGNKVAILDADITGPSIPKMFGIRGPLESDGVHIYPATSRGGISVASANLLLERETDPIIWRGPIITQMVRQFYTDVAYGDCDYLFIDMPPGTGDVVLTIFQSIKMDGIIIVTTPQDLVTMIVEKAINMASEMNIPILGIVENMSYVECPHCGEKIHMFGESKLEEVAKSHDLKILARLPINHEYASLADEGRIENINIDKVDI